jgi:hypothetical protein
MALVLASSRIDARFRHYFEIVIVRPTDYGARGIAMVSLLHEGVIKLVRDCPSFAADLLGQLLDVEVPRFTDARVADATLNELVPIEYRADAVVVFTRKQPVFGAIIEAQLKPDRDKRFTWPLYAASAGEPKGKPRARLKGKPRARRKERRRRC